MSEKDFFTETIGKSFDEFFKDANEKKEGYSSISASSGYSSKSASSGDSSTSASSGDSSKSASSGDSSTSASSGDYSISASSGHYSKSASSGHYSKSASSGDSSISASSGYSSKSASSGDSSKSASSGHYSKSASSGNYSSATCNGFFASVKGDLGNVIMSVEFNKQGHPIGGAFSIVGENGIEADKYYTAHEGKLKELIEVDGINSVLLHRKGNIMKVLTCSFDESYIVSDGNGNYSHGSTIKEAKEDLIFKIGNISKEDYKGMTVDSILSFEDAVKCYRVITGACQFGVKDFLTRKGVKKSKMSIAKIIELTNGEYKSEVFAQFFKN